LKIGIKSQTDKYDYYIKTLNSPKQHEITYFYGVSREKSRKSYVGAVIPAPENETTAEGTMQMIACKTNFPTQSQPTNPIRQKNTLVCGRNTISLAR
jgi:hypothetical protein